MDSSQWAQVSSTTNNINNGTRPPPPPPQQLVEKRTRPVKEQAVNCPRCNSINTKFCYYNNYSLSQPRYFCKTCRRYWTEGGTLRNVPVGGGSRKNKKHSSSNKAGNNQPTNPIIPSNLIMSKPSYQGQDLNLGFENNNMMLPQLFGASFSNNNIENNNGSGGLSAMELLRSTTSAMYGSAAIQNYGASDHHHVKFPLNSIGDHGMHNLFPFGDMKQVRMKSSNEINEGINKGQGEEQAIVSFWNGVDNVGGGGESW